MAYNPLSRPEDLTHGVRMSGVNFSGLRFQDLLAREWISANNLGGYASSTLPGLNTRKYHGLLVAALAPPVRRMVILSRVDETIRRGEKSWQLGCSEYPGTIYPDGFTLLRAFAHEPFPRWAYQADCWTIEKELRLIPGRNTVALSYTLIGNCDEIELELRPLLALRGMHELMYQWNGRLDAQDKSEGAIHLYRIPPTSRTPEVFFAHGCGAGGGEFEPDSHWYLNAIYRRECERGYAGLEDLWNPGVTRLALRPGQTVHFVCSTEPIDLARVIEQANRRPGVMDSTPNDPVLVQLNCAAEQFIVAQSPPAVISGYPWSAPSLRHALMTFGGLFLVSRRFDEGRALLVWLAKQLQDGLIPTEVAEDGLALIYDGADTSLWFVQAVAQYLRYTNDLNSLSDGGLFDACAKIVERYRAGTAGLGIACDPTGLISSRVPGIGTSWMDAKVGDWVITPRQGRTVELNALWYNALRIVSSWCLEHSQPRRAQELTALADRMKLAFNRAFWNESGKYCFDVVMDNGVDASVRPNQLFAISLPHAVLATDRHAPVLSLVEDRLLTSRGLRTLSPEDPSYQGHYAGDVVSRDRAYHQGSAYPWLLGAYTDALLRVYGRTVETRAVARDRLRECLAHLEEHGHLPELFDGDAPFEAGGAIADARSSGEILRAYVENILGDVPKPGHGPSIPSSRPQVKL